MVFAVFLVLATGFMRIVDTIVVAQFEALERESVVQDVGRVRAALGSMADQTDATVGDWSHWDSTFEFLRASSPAYVRDNLSPEALAMVHVDEIVFFDTRYAIRHVAGSDATTTQPQAAPAAEAAILSRLARLLDRGDENDSVQGLVALPTGPAIVALQWVTPSAADGRKDGILAMVRRLDADEIAALCQLTGLEARVSPPGSRSVSLPPDPLQPVQRIGSTYTSVAGENTMRGWSPVADSGGEPAALISVVAPRKASEYATRTLGLVGWGIAGFVALFGLFLFFVLQFTVLRRLTRLHGQVMVAGSAARESRRVDVEGRDEVSELAGAVNRTLLKLGEAEEALQRAADDDYLTGLRNRRRLSEDAEREFAERSRSGGHCSLIVMDMDAFKQVNDTYGHPVGDVVLVHFAAILRDEVRAYSTIARTGGDEFAVFLPHADADETRSFIERLQERVAQDPPLIGGAPVSVGVSIGIAVSPEDGNDLEALAIVADRRLYSAKAQKRAEGREGADLQDGS